MNSAVISRVLALGQAAVLLHASFGNELGVLVGDAVAALVIRLSIVASPPVAQISVLVELAPLVVIPMDGFVSDHGAGRSIVYRVIPGGIEEGRLQNAGRKVDGVGLGILIGIHGRWRHSPLGSVEPLANLPELALKLESRRTLHVGQMIVRPDFQRRVVTPVVGISDLVNLGGQLQVGLLFCLWAHPIHGIDFLAQRSFEVIHHLLYPRFAFRRKGARHISLAQRLSDIAVFRLNAPAPEWQVLLGTEQGLPEKTEILILEILTQRSRQSVQQMPFQICPPVFERLALDQLPSSTKEIR